MTSAYTIDTEAQWPSVTLVKQLSKTDNYKQNYTLKFEHKVRILIMVFSYTWHFMNTIKFCDL